MSSTKGTSKPRPIKAKEPVVAAPPPDFSDTMSAIERDLNKHRIGTFKVHYKDMTFKWKDRANRELTSIERMTVLQASMQNGLYRSDIRHRMSGVVARTKIEKRISHPSNPGPSIPLSEVKHLNEEAMFPLIIFPKNAKKEIEMQSGQHRMAVLKVLFRENEENWWWIVTLYDQELPEAAKEALRINEQDYRVAETEVDVWNQIIHLEGKLQEVGDDIATKTKFESAKKKLEMGLGQRTKSLISMTEYVDVINRILKMPGMHAEFQSKNFEVFSKGRTVEFNVDLLMDILDYWIELLGSEKDLHTVSQYTIQVLRRYSEGDKRPELDQESLQNLFFATQRAITEKKESEQELLFPGCPYSKYQVLHSRFVAMTKRRRGLRSFQSLNTGTKNSLEPFYHVVEHIPYIFDKDARDGYKGGKSIKARPRVETSLVSKFGKREYYAIFFYCMSNWREMKTGSTLRPHEALGAGKEKEALYWSQFEHQTWFQLAWCLIKQWKVAPTDYSAALELKLDAVRSFKKVKDSRGLNLEIVDKIQKMIRSSQELKGYQISASELNNLSENVAATMFSDIDDLLRTSEHFNAAEYDAFESFIPDGVIPRLYVPRRFLDKIVDALVEDYPTSADPTSCHLPLLIEGVTGLLTQSLADKLPNVDLEEGSIWGEMFQRPPQQGRLRSKVIEILDDNEASQGEKAARSKNKKKKKSQPKIVDSSEEEDDDDTSSKHESVDESQNSSDEDVTDRLADDFAKSQGLDPIKAKSDQVVPSTKRKAEPEVESNKRPRKDTVKDGKKSGRGGTKMTG